MPAWRDLAGSLSGYAFRAELRGSSAAFLGQEEEGRKEGRAGGYGSFFNVRLPAPAPLPSVPPLPPPGRSAGPRPLPGAACSASRRPPLPEPSSSPLRRPQQACRTAPPRPRALTILQMEAMFLTVISLKVAAIPHRHLYEVKTAPLMVGRGQEGRGGGGGSGSGLG